MSRNEADANDDKTMRSRIDALHQWLMWHGVSADVRLETTSIGIADAMLSQCKAVVSPVAALRLSGFPVFCVRIDKNQCVTALRAYSLKKVLGKQTALQRPELESSDGAFTQGDTPLS